MFVKSWLSKLSVFKEVSEITWILTLAIFSRLIVFLLLPHDPSSFGPDEGTYSSLAKWVRDGLPASQFPLYGAGLYDSSKSLILPSACLIFLGLNPLFSVRLISLLMGIFSLFIFNSLMKHVSNTFTPTSINLKSLASLRIGVLIIYAFMPSNILWSTLGLRESSVQFWTLLVIYFFLRIFILINVKNNISWKLFFSFSFTFIAVLAIGYGTRPETFLILSLAIFLSQLCNLSRRTFKILAFVSLGSLLGLAFVNTPGEEKKLEKAPIVGEVPAQNSLESKLNSLTIADVRANLNREAANSALPERLCGELRFHVSHLNCVIDELPFRLYSVIFRPLPWIDSGSTALTLASWENLLWLIIFIFFIQSTIRARSFEILNGFWLSLLLFLGIYSIGLALFEGNLGTAFRHKSVLLPLILLLCFKSVLVRLSKEPNKRYYRS